MKVLIVEDEKLAAERLEEMIRKYDTGITIAGPLDTVQETSQYLAHHNDIDVLFLDIQLADGLSFQIFESVQIHTPIIFTTAFDQYTLKAFKVNSIDYLLKPIDEKELEKALDKYQQLHQSSSVGISDKVLQLVEQLNQTKFKERILIKRGQQMGFIKTEQLAYGYAEQTKRDCFLFICSTEYNRWFYVNQGWGGSSNGWVTAKAWFAGEVLPN